MSFFSFFCTSDKISCFERYIKKYMSEELKIIPPIILPTREYDDLQPLNKDETAINAVDALVVDDSNHHLTPNNGSKGKYARRALPRATFFHRYKYYLLAATVLIIALVLAANYWTTGDVLRRETMIPPPPPAVDPSVYR